MAVCADDGTPPFSFAVIEDGATVPDDPEELLTWATRIAARYLGEDRAQEYGRRDSVVGGLLAGYGSARSWRTGTWPADDRPPVRVPEAPGTGRRNGYARRPDPGERSATADERPPGQYGQNIPMPNLAGDNVNITHSTTRNYIPLQSD